MLFRSQFVLTTSDGYIKQVAFNNLLPGRTYRTRPQTAIKLKEAAAQVINVQYLLPEDAAFAEVYLFSRHAYGLHFALRDVPVVGAKAAGVKGMNLKDDDVLVGSWSLTADQVAAEPALAILTQRGAFKKMPLTELPLTNRALRGLQVLRQLKRQPHEIVATQLLLHQDQKLLIYTEQNQQVELLIANVPANDRYSNGSFVLDVEQDGTPVRMALADIPTEDSAN